MISCEMTDRRNTHCNRLQVNIFAFVIYLNAVLLRISVSSSPSPNKHLTQDYFPNDQMFHNLQPESEDDEDTAMHLTPFHEVIGSHLLASHTYRCEPITLTLCKGMYYHQTRMPNMFQHETQEEAGLEAHQFYPLVQINCSEDLRFFLCSIYTPICIKGYPTFLPPCRSVCERVRAGCAPVMEHYHFPWPARLDCGQFPEYNNPEQVLCMERNLTDMDWTTDTDETTPVAVEHGGLFLKQPQTEVQAPSKLNDIEREAVSVFLASARTNQSSNNLAVNLTCSCECRPPLLRVIPQDDSRKRWVSTTGIEDCEMPCHLTDLTYSPEITKGLITSWLTCWAAFCAFSTILTLIYFLFQRHQFRLPELAFVYLSACYFMVSLGYLLRSILGHEAVACDEAQAVSSLPAGSTVLNHSTDLTGSAQLQLKVLRHSSSGQTSCASVFVFIYLFGTAAELWWLILSLTWFLTTGLKWKLESVEKYSQVFHFIVWSIPIGMTTLALLTTVIEGNPFTGLCSIGTRRQLPFILFQLFPKIFFSTVGLVFLISGTIASLCVRKAVKMHNLNPQVHSRRTGLFGWVTLIPNLITIFCLGYESHFSRQWELGYVCDCQYYQTGVREVLPKWTAPKPSVYIFLLKHAMCLVTGVTSFLWICFLRKSNPMAEIHLNLERLCGRTGRIQLLSDREDQEVSSKVLLMSHKSSLGDRSFCESTRDSNDAGVFPNDLNGSAFTQFSSAAYEISPLPYASNSSTMSGKKERSSNAGHFGMLTGPGTVNCASGSRTRDDDRVMKPTEYFYPARTREIQHRIAPNSTENSCVPLSAQPITPWTNPIPRGSKQNPAYSGSRDRQNWSSYDGRQHNLSVRNLNGLNRAIPNGYPNPSSGNYEEYYQTVHPDLSCVKGDNSFDDQARVYALYSPSSRS